jgi:hypothetical protein
VLPTSEDRGDIVLGWLTKVTVVLVLLGLVLFDAVSVGVGRVQAEDSATTAARAAVRAYQQSSDVQVAYAAALRELERDGKDLDTIAPEEFAVDPTTGAVTVTVRRTAPTMLLEKIGPLEHWADTAVEATVRRAT